MLNIYRILGLILIPFIKLNIRNRIRKKKEISNRYKERYGISSYKIKSKKNLIWIHAASVGEFKSADYFISKYYNEYNILITTTTVSAANYALKYYGNKIIHQFAPLDVSIWVKRFLEKWNPKFIIWIESDLWPITLTEFKKRQIKAIFVNARLSPKSLNRWKIAPGIYDNLLNCFLEVFAQSKIDQSRIKSITKKEINYIGNLKLTSQNSHITRNKEIKLTNDLGITRIMIASTHHDEEIKLLPILKKIFKENENIHLIIAPRHPERSEGLRSLFLKNDMISELESSENALSAKIIFIDSFGILSNYYEISDIVFLGGSLINSGGHNPIEPALKKCAILTGPKIFNWQNLFDDMIKDKGCIKIEDLEEFDFKIRDIIKDKNKIDTMKNNAFDFSKKQFVDTQYLDKIIIKYMNSK